MNICKLAFIAVTALSAGACNSQPAETSVPLVETAAPASQPARLEGGWVVAEPVEQRLADNLTITISGMRKDYMLGDRTVFSARVTVNDGGNVRAFRMSGDGVWTRQGSVLSDDVVNVSVVPEVEDAEARTLASAIEQAYRAAPAQLADIEELSARTLRLRDRDNGQLSIATR